MADGEQEKFTAGTLASRKGSLDEDHETRQTTADAAYAEALAVYQQRSDVEPLADRRARDGGEQFTDADFVRDPAYEGFAGNDDTAPHTSRGIPGDDPDAPTSGG